MTKTNAIAIDGPAGAGKSTIAKNLAKALGIIYVDTGAMYRAMAIFMLEKGLTVRDAEAAAGMSGTKEEENAADAKARIESFCEEAEITIGFEKEEMPDGSTQDVQHVFLNGKDVTAHLRTQETGDMASAVSTNGKVRRRLVALQQKLAHETAVVMDGRDIGTVVLPDAKLKIYPTASVEERARRRFLELKEKDPQTAQTLEDVAREIEERDHRDMTRTESPLRRADDAVELDTTGLTIPEVTARVLSLWKKTE